MRHTQEPSVKTRISMFLKQNLNGCSQEHKKPSRQSTKRNHATTGEKENHSYHMNRDNLHTTTTLGSLDNVNIVSLNQLLFVLHADVR